MGHGSILDNSRPKISFSASSCPTFLEEEIQSTVDWPLPTLTYQRKARETDQSLKIYEALTKCWFYPVLIACSQSEIEHSKVSCDLPKDLCGDGAFYCEVTGVLYGCFKHMVVVVDVIFMVLICMGAYYPNFTKFHKVWILQSYVTIYNNADMNVCHLRPDNNTWI